MAARFVVVAGVLGLLGVALGAFGAHLLRPVLPLQKMTIWETAVRYQMWHALALLALAAWTARATLPAPLLHWAGWGLLAGVVLFSGSLYGLVLLDWPWLGAVTPIGGVVWLLAWAALALHGWQARGR